MREQDRDDRLVEESRLAVVGDHEAIPALPLGDELPQGRQPTTVERVGVFDLDRHQPDIAFEDEINLRPGRGAVEECAAVSFGGPRPADWGELVQVHDDRDILQGRIDELPAIDIRSL